MLKRMLARAAKALWWTQMRAAVRRQNAAVWLDTLMRKLKR
jgi:hypothetical protein